MRKAIALAFLAFLVLTAYSPLAFADEDEDDEQEGQEDRTENENRMPGFEIGLAIASSIASARLLQRTS